MRHERGSSFLSGAALPVALIAPFFRLKLRFCDAHPDFGS
jgi:hypothetical protein